MKTLVGPALKYLVLFIVLYSVLTAISMVPKVGGFCNRMYRNPTQPILQAMLPKAYLQIKAEGEMNETLRIEFASKSLVEQQLATAKRTGQPMASITGLNNQVNFQNLFLSFFLFYLVLVMLSPISWGKKCWSLVLGTLLYYFYTVFKLYLVELIFFNEPTIAIYQTGETALKLAKGARFFMNLGSNVLVVLVIWAALVLKKGNWGRVLDAKNI